MTSKTARCLMHSTSSSLLFWRPSLGCLRPYLLQLGFATNHVEPPAPLSFTSSLPFRPCSSVSTKTSQKLPSLPVPPLRATLDKYLKSVRPLVSDNEYRNTENVVIEFSDSSGVGNKLQHLLEKKASNMENWLAEWWLNHSYLNFRSPVVVYSSPGMILPQQSVRSVEDQIKCASIVIAAALDYKRMVDDGLVSQETMGKVPLDMSQNSMIFGTCRIPGVEVDALTFAPHPGDSDDAPRHIVVICNNNFFRVQVYDDDGYALSEHDLIQLLTDVVQRSSKPASAVGILTAENRNVWGKVYQVLSKNPKNRRALSEIQSCLFVVSLDNANPHSDLNYQSIAAAQFIHGGGIQANSGNRWFDKTIQFIVGSSGELGMCYEHSPAEGVLIANISDHVIDFLTGARCCESSQHADGDDNCPRLEAPELLEFDLSNEVTAAIETAGSNLEIIIRDLELSCFTFESFGKNFIKSHKLSPDSFIQVAMQLAFYRIHKELGATYETASTRQFRDGRTETIRSATTEALEFCKLMFDTRATLDDKRWSMEVAINAHKQYVLDAVRGFGVDRHLLGLKLLAVEKAIGVPELYLDAGYVRSTHFRLSSSQVSAKHESFMCYGPSVPDGYGCCYNPMVDEILFGISAFNSCSDTSAVRYGKALRESLEDMHNVLIGSPKARL